MGLLHGVGKRVELRGHHVLAQDSGDVFGLEKDLRGKARNGLTVTWGASRPPPPPEGALQALGIPARGESRPRSRGTCGELAGTSHDRRKIPASGGRLSSGPVGPVSIGPAKPLWASLHLRHVFALKMPEVIEVAPGARAPLPAYLQVLY